MQFRRALLVLVVFTSMTFSLGMVAPQVLGDAEWVGSASLGSTVHAVDFVDETVGYIALGSDGVMRTTDGGESWVDVSPVSGTLNASVDIWDVCFVDARTGWAVGLHTWTPLIPISTESAPSLVTEYSSAIYFTDDAGETWTTQTISSEPEWDLRAVHFYDALHGFVVGDNGTCAATQNGGATWVAVSVAGDPSMPTDVWMASATEAHVVGESGILGVWRLITTPDIPPIIPLANEVEPQAQFWMYSEQTSGVTADLNAVTFVDSDKGWVAMDGRNILRTIDGGDTWESITWDKFVIAVEYMNDVSFVDDQHGWAVGHRTPFGGTLAHSIMVTSDGGASWTRQESGGLTPLYAVDMVSDSFGYTSGDEGTVLRYGATNVTRLAGASRYDTAIDTSGDAFADGSSDYVVVATGRNFADALSASGLAGAYECPLLLTGSTLSPDLTAEIDRVGASTVVLIGGIGAIPQEVEDDLLLAGYTVERIAGENRYDTAAQVGAEVADLNGIVGGQTVIVARGDNFADALAISPFAYSQKKPVLLVRPTSIPAETDAALDAVGARGAILVGGTGAISQEVQDDIDVVLAENGGINSERWFGQNRYETAAVIAENGLGEGFGDASYIGIATGTNFPDALGGGVVCGRRGGVLLLTSPTALSADAEEFITTYKQYDTSVRVFGGEGAVSAAVMSAIEGLF